MPTTEGQTRMHLIFDHGIYTGDVKEFASLVECHANSHDDPDPRLVIPHDHTDTVPDNDREWDWG